MIRIRDIKRMGKEKGNKILRQHKRLKDRVLNLVEILAE